MSIVTNEPDTSVREQKQQKAPFYISRNYVLLWGGQAISNLGDLVFDTTLTLWIATGVAKGQSWAPLAMGGAMLCVTVPSLLLGPAAGVFVDRWDKKLTMIWADIIRCICILLLLVIALPLPILPTGPIRPLLQIGAIYLTLLLTTICSLFFGPARDTIIQEVVHEKEYEHASGISMVTQNISRIIGPSLAAPTLFVFGIQWALLLDAASFLVSVLAVRQVRLKQRANTAHKERSRAAFWHEFREGLLFLGRSRVLIVLLSALSVVMIADAADQTLGVFFMLDNLHAPTYFYGVVGTIGGTGGILGALVATLTVKRLGSLRSFWLGMIGFGFLLFLFSRMTLFIPALVLVFLAGFPIAASNIASGPLMLRSIPRDLLGRVNSVFSTCLSVASILAVSLVTVLASLLQNLHASLFVLQFGPYDTVLSLGGLITLCVGIGVGLSLRKAAFTPVEQQTEQASVQEESQ